MNITQHHNLSLLYLQLEYSKVAAVLEKDQVTFPNNPTVWLMDLATFLNCNFDTISEPDPVFQNKPRGKCSGQKPLFKIRVLTLN